MTPFRGRPEFPALVAAVRAGDCHPGIFCDWLEEFGTTADVMTLYALPRVLHVLRHEGGPGASYSYAVPPDQDDSLRPVLAEWADRHGPPGRAADVRAWCCEQTRRAGGGGDIDVWTVGKLRFADGLLIGSSTNSEPAARRELKRRVLGLFADVRVPCPACGGGGRDRTRRYFGEPAKYPTCDRCRGSGTVAPAGLIPPEPSPAGVSGGVTADDYFADMTAQSRRDHGIIDGPH